jgi:hypothetical protein
MMKVDVNHNLNADLATSRSADALGAARPTAPEFRWLNDMCSTEVAKATLEKNLQRPISIAKINAGAAARLRFI